MRELKLSMIETQELSVKACSHLMTFRKEYRRISLKPARMIMEPPGLWIRLLYKALRILLKPERVLSGKSQKNGAIS